MKFLSIYITGTLKWNSHVQSLANKLSEVSFMIVLKGDFKPLYDSKCLFYYISGSPTVWDTKLGVGGNRG